MTQHISKVQQLISMDEINAGEIEQLWLDAVIKSQGIVPERLPAEITSEKTSGENNVTTVWSQNRPVAIAVRQRDVFNYTVLTLIEIAREVGK